MPRRKRLRHPLRKRRSLPRKHTRRTRKPRLQPRKLPARKRCKLLEEYDEKQEAAASSEVIEVKVVAYTEHGVVVDLGGKTEGLVPAAEFADTEIPRPEPNSTIEVQRTGEHKDGFTILSYLKVLRRRTWEKIDAAFRAKETITGKIVDRI